jgi:hypothetical protein
MAFLITAMKLFIILVRAVLDAAHSCGNKVTSSREVSEHTSLSNGSTDRCSASDSAQCLLVLVVLGGVFCSSPNAHCSAMNCRGLIERSISSPHCNEPRCVMRKYACRPGDIVYINGVVSIFSSTHCSVTNISLYCCSSIATSFETRPRISICFIFTVHSQYKVPMVSPAHNRIPFRISPSNTLSDTLSDIPLKYPFGYPSVTLLPTWSSKTPTRYPKGTSPNFKLYRLRNRLPLRIVTVDCKV